MSVTTEVQVVGMTCQHCVTAVTEEVSEIPGVTSVDVSLDSGRVIIQSHTELNTAAISAAIAEAGYDLA